MLHYACWDDYRLHQSLSGMIHKLNKQIETSQDEAKDYEDGTQSSRD